MAKKRKQNPHTGQEEEYEEDNEHGTQHPDPIRGETTDPIRGALGGKDHEKSEREKNLAKEESMLRKQREEDQKQREAASKEYEEKMEEADKAAEEEAAARGEERTVEEPPPECPQFEGYGEFIVPKDVNIRHKDQARGSRVALSWEDYQDLRKNGIYCEPVPQPAEPVEGTPV